MKACACRTNNSLNESPFWPLHHRAYFLLFAKLGLLFTLFNPCCFPAVLSVLGNVAVLVTALKRSSRLKPPELLSVNLAVTDLGMTISMYPLAIASAWNHRWLGGDGSCIYYGLMGFFFGVASILTLTMMAITRFIVTTNLQVPGEFTHLINYDVAFDP